MITAEDRKTKIQQNSTFMVLRYLEDKLPSQLFG